MAMLRGNKLIENNIPNKNKTIAIIKLNTLFTIKYHPSIYKY